MGVNRGEETIFTAQEIRKMFLSVDYSRCNKDGLCVLECPARIIKMEEDGPVAVDGAEKLCIRCGHCVAICPEAALSLEFLSPESCRQVDEALSLDARQAEYFLKSRRSIRTYRKKSIPKSELEKIIGIASSAPTGSNRQPVQWIIVHEKEKVQAIATHVVDWLRFMCQKHPETAANFNMESLVRSWEEGVDRICRNAPHLLFAFTARDIGSGKADCDNALAYLELALPAFGLGSCWAGYVTNAVNRWPPLAEFLGVSDDEQIHGALMLGYPKFRYQRIPERNRPLITYL